MSCIIGTKWVVITAVEGDEVVRVVVSIFVSVASNFRSCVLIEAEHVWLGQEESPSTWENSMMSL